MAHFLRKTALLRPGLSYLARSCIPYLKFYDGPSNIARFYIFFLNSEFFSKMSQILSKFHLWVRLGVLITSSYELEKRAKLLGPFLYMQIYIKEWNQYNDLLETSMPNTCTYHSI